MSIQELAKIFGLNKRTKGDKPQILDRLLQKPFKDKGKNIPHFQPKDENITQQIDLLFLPDDNGYKYALMVADIGGKRKLDAEPLKKKDSASVLTALKAIYSRDILKVPAIVEMDPGSEFKGEVEKWFKSEKVAIRVGKTGRHRQQ